jgi:hypothetical protein
MRARINPDGKRVLLPLIRSGLFSRGDIRKDELILAYRTLYKEIPSDYFLNISIRHLEKIGLLYRERSFRDDFIIKVPSYIYALLPEIEAKIEKTEEE